MDKDFVAILNYGIKILNKQAKQIEDKLLFYGGVLPTRFAETIPSPETTQIIEDRFMFNSILSDMQYAAALHGNALQEIITNDDIRKFFKELTFSELNIIDNMIKYGKVKGWLQMPPAYKFN